MTWKYWMSLYLQRHCTARGLRSSTIEAYQATLEGFRNYVRFRLEDISPDTLTPMDVLQYVDYLRKERDNGASAVNRQVTVIKNFYRAIVAMGHLEHSANPMAHFPKIKASARKLPVSLSEEDTEKLIDAPRTDTVLGLRDRAMLMLLYGTGIRASECANLRECDIDFSDKTIRVDGKGGHQRIIPLHQKVIDALRAYRTARGEFNPKKGFFRSRKGNTVSRNTVYERVRKYSRQSRMEKHVTPHTLRHTFATHLVRTGSQIHIVADILGHRNIQSTNIYIHMTAEDLRGAAERHPVSRLSKTIENLLPDVKLPFQKPRAQDFG